MIIVDERHYLAKQLENQGLGIYDFFENRQAMDLEAFNELPLTRKPEILLVDTQTILNHPNAVEKFKVILNTFIGVIFFHDEKNDAAKNWINDNATLLPKIIGQYPLPMTQLEWTILTNQLNFLWDIREEQKNLQKNIVKFSHELDQALQNAENEMEKAKKIHSILVPKRTEEIKGVSFINKYATGDGRGAEFYDLHHSGNKIFQILISSQSYLISSSLIGLLNHHKQIGFKTDSFLQEAKNEIEAINGSKKKKSDVELTILELDATHLTLQAAGWGKAEFYSQLNGKVDLGLGALQTSKSKLYQLTKGEKMIVISPGFIFNWIEGQIKQELHSFLKSHYHLSQSDLLLELFLQLNSVKEGDFLSKDATVVMMEVNRHGIHQI